MKKPLTQIKATVILGIFLLSMFVAFASNGSAQIGLINYNTVLTVSYNANEAEESVAPLEDLRSVQLKIQHSNTGLLSRPLEWISNKYKQEIHLTVGETEDWVTATLTDYVVLADLDLTSTETIDFVSVVIKLTEDAPANSEVVIPIKAVAQEINVAGIVVHEQEAETLVRFQPQFLPIFNIQPEATLLEVAPGEVARFPINIENQGNGKTEFTFDIKNLPEDWSASIVTTTTVESVKSSDNTKTVYLEVTPSYAFGYHNEQKDIKLEVTARFFAYKDDSGNATSATKTNEYIFSIRNKGFSTPGFESICLVSSFVFRTEGLPPISQ